VLISVEKSQNIPDFLSLKELHVSLKLITMKRSSIAIWKGTGKDGRGFVSSTSGALKETPYSFFTRFVNEDGKAGTNPEELIAAAHAACFNMALSFQIDRAGFTATELSTQATVTVEKINDHFQITGSHLDLTGIVSSITSEKFIELAETAKKGCPVSMALASIPITISIKLEGEKNEM